jgi:hypothetical protein
MMKFSMIRRFLPGLIWLSGMVSGPAQEAQVSLRIDMVAWGNDIRGLSVKSGSGADAVDAKAFTYSKPLTYAGPQVMEVFQSEEGAKGEVKTELTGDDKLHELIPLAPEPETPAAGGDKPKSSLEIELAKRREKLPNLVALVPLPAGCPRATVLLAPAGKGTYQAFVIDDDPAKLPLGEVRVHNLSPYPIAIRCNSGDLKQLKTRESFVSKAPDGYFIYELKYLVDGEWKYQENNVIPIRPIDQSQVVILSSDNQFFRSADGSKNGFLQIVTLRRYPKP